MNKLCLVLTCAIACLGLIARASRADSIEIRPRNPQRPAEPRKPGSGNSYLGPQDGPKQRTGKVLGLLCGSDTINQYMEIFENGKATMITVPHADIVDYEYDGATVPAALDRLGQEALAKRREFSWLGEAWSRGVPSTFLRGTADASGAKATGGGRGCVGVAAPDQSAFVLWEPRFGSPPWIPDEWERRLRVRDEQLRSIKFAHAYAPEPIRLRFSADGMNLLVVGIDGFKLVHVADATLVRASATNEWLRSEADVSELWTFRTDSGGGSIRWHERMDFDLAAGRVQKKGVLSKADVDAAFPPPAPLPPPAVGKVRTPPDPPRPPPKASTPALPTFSRQITAVTTETKPSKPNTDTREESPIHTPSHMDIRNAQGESIGRVSIPTRLVASCLSQDGSQAAMAFGNGVVVVMAMTRLESLARASAAYEVPFMPAPTRASEASPADGWPAYCNSLPQNVGINDVQGQRLKLNLSGMKWLSSKPSTSGKVVVVVTRATWFLDSKDPIHTRLGELVRKHKDRLVVINLWSENPSRPLTALEESLRKSNARGGPKLPWSSHAQDPSLKLESWLGLARPKDSKGDGFGLRLQMMLVASSDGIVRWQGSLNRAAGDTVSREAVIEAVIAADEKAAASRKKTPAEVEPEPSDP